MMAEKDIVYRRLPGRSRKLFSVSSAERLELWLGPDHVLLLRKLAFSERCKRFYFRDIQAIVICRTTTAKLISAALIALSIGSGLMTISTVAQWGPWAWFLAVLPGIFVIATLVNLVRGPTCVCRLHTAVQQEDLVSLRRLRAAQKTLAILRPMIEAVQGPLRLDDTAAPSTEEEAVAPSAHAIVEPAPASTPPRERVHEQGRIHGLLFSLFLMAAFSNWFDIFYQDRLKNFAEQGLWLALAILTALAIRRQSNSDLSGELKRVTWAAAGVIAGAFLLGFFVEVPYLVVHNAGDPSIFLHPYDMRFEGPFFTIYFGVMGAIFALVGTVGLLMLRDFHVAYNAASAAADTSLGP